MRLGNRAMMGYKNSGGPCESRGPPENCSPQGQAEPGRSPRALRVRMPTVCTRVRAAEVCGGMKFLASVQAVGPPEFCAPRIFPCPAVCEKVRHAHNPGARTAPRRGRIYSGFRHWYNGDRGQRWSSLSLVFPRAAARKPGSRTPQAERFSVMEMHSLTAM